MSSLFIRRVCRGPCPKSRKRTSVPFSSMCVMLCIDDIMTHIGVLYG